MDQHVLSLSDFDFTVPESLVAQEALPQRDQSKMLYFDKHKQLVHKRFFELDRVYQEPTLFVFNDSRVFPSRIFTTRRTGGRLELFLITPPSPEGKAQAFAKPSRKLNVGDQLALSNTLSCQIINKDEGKTPPVFDVQFYTQGILYQELEQIGLVPLPPYIKRETPLPFAESADASRYQTVYAKATGSVAAPTAGLHFTEDMLTRLKEKGHEIAFVTLHVGAGTFLPVSSENIDQHHMHTEQIYIPKATWDRMKSFNRVIAVGTTSFRAIEGLGQKPNPEDFLDQWQDTSIFIRPKNKTDLYTSKWVDGLITNFHQPKSTLFMLICALIGYEEALMIYKEAIAQQYRFYSYGDCCLLEFRDIDHVKH